MHQATNRSKPCVRPFPSQAQPSPPGTGKTAQLTPSQQWKAIKNGGKALRCHEAVPLSVSNWEAEGNELFCRMPTWKKSSLCVSPPAHPGTHTAILPCASEQDQFLCPTSTVVTRSAPAHCHSSQPASGNQLTLFTCLWHLSYALCHFEFLCVEKKHQLLFSIYGWRPIIIKSSLTIHLCSHSHSRQVQRLLEMRP